MKKQNNTDEIYMPLEKFLCSDEEEMISFTAKCSMEVLDDVIEWFGMGVGIKKDTDKYFILHAVSTEEYIIRFFQKHLNNTEILEPKDIRDKILKNIQESIEKYKNIY